MGFLFYFKNRGSIGGIGTWAPLYLEDINVFFFFGTKRIFFLHGWPSWKITRAQPQTGKFMSKVEEKPSVLVR